MKPYIRGIHIMVIFVPKITPLLCPCWHLDNECQLKNCLPCVWLEFRYAVGSSRKTPGHLPAGGLPQVTDFLTFGCLLYLQESVARFQEELHKWKHLPLCQDMATHQHTLMFFLQHALEILRCVCLINRFVHRSDFCLVALSEKHKTRSQNFCAAERQKRKHFSMYKTGDPKNLVSHRTGR